MEVQDSNTDLPPQLSSSAASIHSTAQNNFQYENEELLPEAVYSVIETDTNLARADSSEIYRRITHQIYGSEGDTSPRRVGAEPTMAKAVKIDENKLNGGCIRNEWVQALIGFAEQHGILVEVIICLPLLLMTLYILVVEQGTIFKYENSN